MQEALPFITICMPTYNTNWCLGEVLNSIYNIDYPKNYLRLVFVDSDSIDGTCETLQRFKENHGHEYESAIVVRTPKRGVGHARNICLGYLKGWVFWADSDVILPPLILKHLLSHFHRNLKVGWTRCAWIRRKPSLYERIAMSRIPRAYRYVDETELTNSLIRPEAMQAFGLCYEDGGEPFDSWEAAEQHVKVRKAGWKIVNDGTLSCQCVHLIPHSQSWGRIIEAGTAGKEMVKLAIKRISGIWRYYFLKFPRKPVHMWIKAGDVKCVLKVIYYFTIPYLIVGSILIPQPLILLALSPALVYYCLEVRGWQMKIIAPFTLMFRWILVAQGYAFLVLKMFAKRLFGPR